MTGFDNFEAELWVNKCFARFIAALVGFRCYGLKTEEKTIFHESLKTAIKTAKYEQTV